MCYDDGDGRFDIWCENEELEKQPELWDKDRGTIFYKDPDNCPFFEPTDD